MPRSSSPGRPYWPDARVRVRDLSEILGTLDEDGSLDALPFMPEMARFAGREFRVARTAGVVCVEGETGLRQLPDTVILDGLRCDGAQHDGCQRQCALLWKTSWLEPVTTAAPAHDAEPADSTALSGLRTHDGERYYCQATELAAATLPLARWDIRPLFRDLRRREITVPRLVRVLWVMVYNKIVRRLGFRGIGRPVGTQTSTSPGDLDLQAGEKVRVKSRADIEAALTADGHNRGLTFEYEMLSMCGDVCEVAYPIEKIILEENGKMQRLSNSVVVENARCEGILRRNCPRANHFYWREAWLTRIDDDR